ncbi:MAG TPA: bifunctional demethylmenaquinone methyltransferase/2-methoxy-6-polyprenyl-1,4-benzoquinol methylase UbiE [Gammaproteobacteria bacterium]|nr:bifunctional demethylmenaquinone methyltransferase/2-methoxy-6-polyprenyl-1,4-benzoquinol methylase UbiE [Gammaproteobacteria bacterium]
MTNNETSTTHFGFQEVPVEEKAKRVADVFHTVAERYDLMNDLMSFGLHRLWKNYTLSKSHVRTGQVVLDIAGGTGDLTKGFSKKVGPTGSVYLADINNSMLMMGRNKLIDLGFANNIFYTQANAESLPFKKNHFDCISISFGLRNVTDKNKALRSMYETLKPGGVLLILEFSKPVLPILEKLYDQYSFNIVPKLGELITGSKDSYQYLVESIRKHPDQESLKQMILDAGFEKCEYFNLTGGIVCLHRAYKI